MDFEFNIIVGTCSFVRASLNWVPGVTYFYMHRIFSHENTLHTEKYNEAISRITFKRYREDGPIQGCIAGVMDQVD